MLKLYLRTKFILKMFEIANESYKIDFFLDTNILVDYIQGENLNLVNSLEYLAQCNFVNLHSSHYVEFEFTEVMKRNEFYKVVHGKYPPKGMTNSIANIWQRIKQIFARIHLLRIMVIKIGKN